MTAVFLIGVLMLVTPHAYSQCEIKRYQDMLIVSAGPSCLTAAGARESIASGVKQIVGELNEASPSGEGGAHQLSAREKLYRLAEMQHRDNLARELRMQNDLRQNNRFASHQRGLD